MALFHQLFPRVLLSYGYQQEITKKKKKPNEKCEISFGKRKRGNNKFK